MWPLTPAESTRIRNTPLITTVCVLQTGVSHPRCPTEVSERRHNWISKFANIHPTSMTQTLTFCNLTLSTWGPWVMNVGLNWCLWASENTQACLCYLLRQQLTPWASMGVHVPICNLLSCSYCWMFWSPFEIASSRIYEIIILWSSCDAC